MLKLKQSLNKYIIRSMLFIAFVTIVSVFTFWFIFEMNEFNSDAEYLINDSMQKQKNKVMQEVEQVIYYIDYYRQNSKENNLETLQNELLKYIATIRFDKEGYIFVNQFDGLALVFDGKFLEEGRYVQNLENPNGEELYRKERNAVNNPDGEFIEYSFKKMEGNEVVKKISFIRGDSEWQWMIGSGVYIEDIQSIITKKQIELKRDLINYMIKSTLVIIPLMLLLFTFGYFGYLKTMKDLAVFKKFFQKSANIQGKINEDELVFAEFKKLGIFTNRMIDDINASERRFQSLQNNIPIGIFRTNESGEFISFNEELCNILGYNKAELKKINAADIYLNKDRDDINKLHKNNKLDNIETQFLKKDKTIIWVRITSKVVIEDNKILYIDGVIEDITEKKAIKNELIDSEMKYSKIFEVSPEPIIVHTDGKLVAINKAAAFLFNCKDHDKFLGRPIMDFVHPDFQQSSKERVYRMLDEGVTQSLIEEQFIIDKKTVIDVEVAATPIMFKHKKSILVVFRDITEKKKARRELKKQSELLKKAVEQKTKDISERNLALTKANESLIKFNKAFINRELKMVELKKRIKELEEL